MREVRRSRLRPLLVRRREREYSPSMLRLWLRLKGMSVGSLFAGNTCVSRSRNWAASICETCNSALKQAASFVGLVSPVYDLAASRSACGQLIGGAGQSQTTSSQGPDHEVRLLEVSCIIFVKSRLEVSPMPISLLSTSVVVRSLSPK